jgi:hypothetical protein
MEKAEHRGPTRHHHQARSICLLDYSVHLPQDFLCYLGESVIRHPPYPVRKPLGLCVHVKGHTVVDPKGRIQVIMRLMGLEISRR